MRNRIAWRVLVLCVSLSLVASARGQITPTADAYTDSGSPTTNFGRAATLNVQSSSQSSYIKFDLSSIPTGYTGTNIAKASLKLYVNQVITAGSFNVDLVNGAWSESKITADLSPALGSTIVSGVVLTKAQSGNYIVIDVTSAVGDWLDGTQANDGIALVANALLSATIDSKENTTSSHPPELDVIYNGVQGPPGPAGPPGPIGQTGATGPRGAQGATGPAGPQGPIGQTGATGPAGPQGPTGATGAQGATGATGPIGPAGPGGITGVQLITTPGTTQFVVPPNTTHVLVELIGGGGGGGEGDSFGEGGGGGGSGAYTKAFLSVTPGATYNIIVAAGGVGFDGGGNGISGGITSFTDNSGTILAYANGGNGGAVTKNGGGALGGAGGSNVGNPALFASPGNVGQNQSSTVGNPGGSGGIGLGLVPNGLFGSGGYGYAGPNPSGGNGAILITF
jgi:collagen triple helix repeat protein/glycine rich protein/TGF-beta propeptide